MQAGASRDPTHRSFRDLGGVAQPAAGPRCGRRSVSTHGEVGCERPERTAPNSPGKKLQRAGGAPYRVRFDLREPDPAAEKEGDQDPVRFKTKGDTHNRTHEGQRRPSDYDAERAAQILFIPETLLNPDRVHRVRNEPWKVVYAARAAPDEHFVLLVEEASGNPRFSFGTAYPMTQDELKAKRKSWDRLFPIKPKHPKKKRKK